MGKDIIQLFVLMNQICLIWCGNQHYMAECPTKSACKEIHRVKQVDVAWWKCDCGRTSDIRDEQGR